MKSLKIIPLRSLKPQVQQDSKFTRIINFQNPEFAPKLRKLLGDHPPMGVVERLPNENGYSSWILYFLDNTQKNLAGFQKAFENIQEKNVFLVKLQKTRG